MEYLYDKLKKYSKSDWYGFHMPGHKRNGSITGVDLPYDIDITEISGFDDLHHPKGVLQEAEARPQKYIMRRRRITWLMGVQWEFSAQY